jgi:hypothetical protein
LTALERGSLTLETEAGAAKVPLSRVEAVIFGLRAGGSPSARPQPREFAFGLRDGTLVYARDCECDEKKLTITLGDGVKLDGGTADDVVAIQSLGKPLVYLADLEPAGYRHVPYLSIEWPYARDRNVLGEPLLVSGKRYLKGIGMHSASRLTYHLGETFRRFDAQVALDESAGKRGSVTFGVYLERDGKWGEVFVSNVVRGGDAPLPVSIDVEGATGITLTVDYADRGDQLDRAVWLDARLMR